jgi:hypothetical protein
MDPPLRERPNIRFFDYARNDGDGVFPLYTPVR